MKKRSEERGMSLVETMIAGAVSIAMMMAVGKMLMSTNSQVNNSEKRLEVVSVLSEIRGNLTNPSACENSFKNANANDSTKTGTISEIKKADGSTLFSTGSVIGSTGIKINSIQLNSSDPGVTVVPGGGNGSTHLELVFDRNTETGSSKTIKKKIRLNVNTEAKTGSNLVNTCNAFSTGESDVWVRDTADPTKISYSGGNVGVGIASPGYKLEVDGIISSSKSIKVGDDNDCDSSVVGKIRYSKSKRSIEYCGQAGDKKDAYKWRPFVGKKIYAGPHCPPGETKVRTYYEATKCTAIYCDATHGGKSGGSCTTKAGWGTSPKTCTYTEYAKFVFNKSKNYTACTKKKKTCKSKARFTECEL